MYLLVKFKNGSYLLAIIQARLDSKRFPGKSLFKIYGVPLIERVYDRVNSSKEIKQTVISIPKDDKNKKLKLFLKKKNLKFYEGNNENVTLRMYKAAKKFKSNYFVRISGDSPMIDPLIIDHAVKIHKKKKIDVITNTYKRSCPSGQSVELIRVNTLKKILKYKLTLEEKEHVTKYFYNNKKKFKIFNFYVKNIKLKNFKFSVDFKKDLKKLLKKFGKNEFANFSLKK